jgi:hypothetical protein
MDDSVREKEDGNINWVYKGKRTISTKIYTHESRVKLNIYKQKPKRKKKLRMFNTS